MQWRAKVPQTRREQLGMVPEKPSQGIVWKTVEMQHKALTKSLIFFDSEKDEDEEGERLDTICEVCGSGGDDEKMLLCDHCDNGGSE